MALSSDLLHNSQLLLKEKLKQILAFLASLGEDSDENVKKAELEKHPLVKSYLEKPSYIRTYLSGLSPSCSVIIYSLIFLEQYALFEVGELGVDVFEKLRVLTHSLMEVEDFYKGGLLGYHALFLQLLLEDKKEEATLIDPKGEQLYGHKHCQQWVDKAIEKLPELAIMLPLAGAGERLKLTNQDGQPLPVAKLHFCHYSLLEHIVREVQAWEYLYFQRYHKKLCIPFLVMTSDIHNNHQHIQEMVQGLPPFISRDRFYFFKQPLVPVVSKEGEWLCQEPLKLILRPGGHGALWPQARKPLLNLYEKGIRKVLVRQINNPLAAIDHTLLAFIGLGFERDYDFGFASCPRRVGSPEGMNVLMQDNKYQWLSNIEYTDFEKRGLEDKASQGNYSRFPSNTNLLFGDIQALTAACSHKPLFAPTINFKSSYSAFYTKGRLLKKGGRVESMMQNIADAIKTPINDELRSYLTFSPRYKTLSTCKKAFEVLENSEDTPLSCFYDYYQNAHELLTKAGVLLSEKVEYKKLLEKRLSVYFYYHPALGPMFSLIIQKIKGGKIDVGSYLHLEIAELQLEELSLKGALIVSSKNPTGLGEKSTMKPRASLLCCRVVNEGICSSAISPKQLWEGDMPFNEKCRIDLGEGAVFEAENVQFEGNIHLTIPDYTKVVAIETKEGLQFQKKPLPRPPKRK